MFGVLQDKVLDRALVELEGDPAHGRVEAHLVGEGELQELTLLVGGGGSGPAPDLLGEVSACSFIESSAIARATSRSPIPRWRIEL
jgi:hypothetical protein